MTLAFVLKKTKDICLLLTAVPVVALLIALDRVYSLRALSNGIPSHIDELVRNPQLFLDLLRRGGRVTVGPNAVVKSLTTEGGSETEPGKDRTTMKVVLVYLPDKCVPGEVVELKLFVKVPSSRGVSVFLRAVAAVFVAVHKEVGFYTILAPALLKHLREKSSTSSPSSSSASALLPFVDPGLPFNAPRCFFAGRARWVDRTCIILDDIDTRVMMPLADWKGATPTLILAQLSNAAALHASTWDCKACPESAIYFIEERKGIAWLEGVMTLVQHRLAPEELVVWKALCAAIRKIDPSMCISHADCRPGNMLFRSSLLAATHRIGNDAKVDAKSSQRWGKEDVIVTDWEACSATPYLWDCAYAMVIGLTPTVRRANQREIVRVYLDLVDAELIQQHGPDHGFHVPTLDEAMDFLPVMYFAVQLYSWILDKVGGVGDVQGNSTHDMKAWRERVREMLHDVLTEGSATRELVWKALGGQSVVPSNVLQAYYEKSVKDLTD